jgi:DNA-binding transcriptional ArsR family regulator
MQNKRIGLTGFSTLGDETRLKIFLKIVELASFSFLGEEPIVALNTAKHLGEVFDLAKSTISHHIDVLKNAGLIFEVKKKKFIYLFPNFTTISEFRDFLDNEVMVYLNEGKYLCAADLRLPKIPDIELTTLEDFLTINGCKNVMSTKDQAGATKIYFKITGFNEPFYCQISGNDLKIFCLQKNYSDSKSALENLAKYLMKSF